MRKLVLFVLVLCSGYSFSQSDSTKVKIKKLKATPASKFWDSESSREKFFPIRNTVSGYFNYLTNSNVVSNSFVNTFLYKDFIENTVKDDVTNLMNSKVNRFGVDIDAGIEFKILPNKSHFKTNSNNNFLERATKIFKIGQRDFTSLKFSDNFFELYFRGNKQFAGQSITIDPVDYTNFSYQYFGYGLEYDLSDDERFGASIKLLKGSRFTDVRMPTAQLYTATDGDSLNFIADINYASADNEQPRLSSFQGFGTAFDLIYKKAAKSFNYEFGIEDLGFISWSGINTFQANSEWAFTGVQINDILNINGNEFNGVEPDSLSNLLGIKNQVRGRFFILPTKLQAKLSYPLTTSIILDISTRYYIGAANIPRLAIKASYGKLKGPNEFLKPHLTLAYGGFSKLDAAIGVDWNTYDFSLSLQAFYIEPLINAAKTTGQGASLTFGYNIR